MLPDCCAYLQSYLIHKANGIKPDLQSLQAVTHHRLGVFLCLLRINNDSWYNPFRFLCLTPECQIAVTWSALHLRGILDSLWLCSVWGDPTLVVRRPPTLPQMLHSTSGTQTPRAHSTPAYSSSYLQDQARAFRVSRYVTDSITVVSFTKTKQC